jgi:hypothetical protein
MLHNLSVKKSALFYQDRMNLDVSINIYLMCGISLLLSELVDFLTTKF